jgi:hypothetical protein
LVAPQDMVGSMMVERSTPSHTPYIVTVQAAV